MQLQHLVDTSRAIAATRSRKEKIARLADLVRALDPREVEVGVPFLAGEFRQGKIGVGPALVRELRDVPPAPRATWSLLDVDRALDEVGAAAGAGSKERKRDLLRALLAGATEHEGHFLRRLLVGELRQGALEGILLEGVAAASGVPAADVRRAAMLGGSLADVALAVARDGAAGLARFRIEVGRPLQPMLAGTAQDCAEVLTAFGRAAFEWKLDGARLQVHKDGARVRAFTRHLRDVTAAVPEVVEAVRALPAADLVLDGEVIAFAADGRPRPFQETMSRFGRSKDVAAERARTPLTTVFFDLLHLDGEEHVDRPADERWDALARVVPPELCIARTVTDDPEEAERVYADALARGHEGLVAKDPTAPYEAGRRGARWRKLKPAHTLDLVVLAAEWGSGRRAGFLSNLHLGARDDVRGGFVMLGKTFKGLTDEVLRWQTQELLSLETHRDGHVVFVRPERVVEIAFDGTQRSPRYPGGVALRFARLVRYRPDKPASEADTLSSVLALG